MMKKFFTVFLTLILSVVLATDSQAQRGGSETEWGNPEEQWHPPRLNDPSNPVHLERIVKEALHTAYAGQEKEFPKLRGYLDKPDEQPVKTLTRRVQEHCKRWPCARLNAEGIRSTFIGAFSDKKEFAQTTGMNTYVGADIMVGEAAAMAHEAARQRQFRIAQLKREAQEKRNTAVQKQTEAKEFGVQAESVGKDIKQTEADLQEAKDNRDGADAQIVKLQDETQDKLSAAARIKVDSVGGVPLGGIKQALDNAAGGLEQVKQTLKRMGYKDEDIQKVVDFVGVDPTHLAASIRDIAKEMKPEMGVFDLIQYKRKLQKNLDEAKADEEKTKNTAAKERAEVARYDADIEKAKDEKRMHDDNRKEHDRKADEHDAECRKDWWSCTWRVPAALWERSMAALDRGHMGRVDTWIGILNMGKFFPASVVAASDAKAAPYSYARQQLEKQISDVEGTERDLQKRIDDEQEKVYTDFDRQYGPLEGESTRERNKAVELETKLASLPPKVEDLNVKKAEAEKEAEVQNAKAGQLEAEAAELEKQQGAETQTVATQTSDSGERGDSRESRSGFFFSQSAGKIQARETRLREAESRAAKAQAVYKAKVEEIKKRDEAQTAKESAKKPLAMKQEKVPLKEEKAKEEKALEAQLKVLQQQEAAEMAQHQKELEAAKAALEKEIAQEKVTLDKELTKKHQDVMELKRKADEAYQKMMAALEKQKKEEELAKKKALEEELAKKKALEEEAKKQEAEKQRKLEEEVAKKKAEEELAQKKALEEATKQKRLAEEEAAKKKALEKEELAKQKAEAELAKKKAQEELAKKQEAERQRKLAEEEAKKQEELAKMKLLEEKAARKKAEEELARKDDAADRPALANPPQFGFGEKVSSQPALSQSPGQPGGKIAAGDTAQRSALAPPVGGGAVLKQFDEAMRLIQGLFQKQAPSAGTAVPMKSGLSHEEMQMGMRWFHEMLNKLQGATPPQPNREPRTEGTPAVYRGGTVRAAVMPGTREVRFPAGPSSPPAPRGRGRGGVIIPVEQRQPAIPVSQAPAPTQQESGGWGQLLGALQALSGNQPQTQSGYSQPTSSPPKIFGVAPPAGETAPVDTSWTRPQSDGLWEAPQVEQEETQIDTSWTSPQSDESWEAPQEEEEETQIDTSWKSPQSDESWQGYQDE